MSVELLFAPKERDSLLVEPLQGISSLQVGVLPLPLLEVEGGLGQVVQGVLLLGLGGDKVNVLVLVNLLCLGLLLSLGCGGLLLLGLLGLLLLLGCDVGRGSVGEGRLAVVKDSGELGVVDDATLSVQLSGQRGTKLTC
jgi:hypothetical protein